jgi:5-methylcytosine-specific restriction protein A
MAREVDEWIGKTDDTPAPPRVRQRVFDRYDGRCHKCTRQIDALGGESWTLEHLIAIINGGENRERNLRCTCENCLPVKNAEDMAIKKKNTRVRNKARGIKPARNGFATNRNGKFKKLMDGTVVRRT